MKKREKQGKVPYALFISTFSLFIASCVISAGFEYLEELTATPQEYYWPIGEFDPLKNLRLLAVYSTGESLAVPPGTATHVWPDINTKGKQTGSAAYESKTGAHSIFVYDPAEGRPTSDGGGTIIKVPAW